MVNTNAKTPNKGRKSLPNIVGESPNPKKTTLDNSIKTPGKNKNNNATPGKGNKTPKVVVGQNNSNKTPKSPFKNQQQSNKKNKRASESENENSPPKKLKKFSGTSELEASKKKKKAPQNKSGPKSETKKIKRKGQFHQLKVKVDDGDKAAVEEIESKIEAIKGRKELTKTAKRKLKMLLKLKSVALGEKEKSSPAPLTLSKKRRQRKQETKAKHSEATADQAKDTKKKLKTVSQGNDESESSDYEVESEVQPDKVAETGLGSDDEESGEEEEASGDEEESADEEEEEGGSGEEDSEEGSDAAEEVEASPKGKKPQPKQVNTPNLKDLQDNKIVIKDQSRYVLFVGNLAYDATKQEISEHFNKAGIIRHIRIPTDIKTNRPRGFAYVEFDNEVAYQKGLSLHHTSIKGRRINVLYTQGGKKKGEEKKKAVKAKNFKLQAMRKQGQLAGSVKATQKRSARRAKKNSVTAVNGS